MAKKAKSATATDGGGEGVSPSYIDRIWKQVESDYGEGVLAEGKSIIDSVKQVIPIGPCLDLITGGGLEEGSWAGITGHPKTNKSSTALSFAANAQRPEFGSRPIFYAKVEGRLSRTLLAGTKGLELARPHFNLIQSIKGRILSAEDYLRILSDVLRTVPKAVIIIDSISALCEERELTGGIGTETRGGGAKRLSEFCRQMANVVPVNDSIVIGITHLISNTSGFGAKFFERAARAWQYQCDYQLQVKQCSPWAVGERRIGAEVKWICHTSKRASPGMTVSSFIRYGLGIDKVHEGFQLGVCSGLIRKDGSWYHLDYLSKYAPQTEEGGPVRAHGQEKANKLLCDNPQWMAILEAELAGQSSVDLVGVSSADESTGD